MYNAENICEHLNQVTDQHEGSIICQDCGLVLSDYFETDERKDKSFNFHDVDEINQKNDYANKLCWLEEIKDILDRIHIPCTYATHILRYFNGAYKSKNFNNLYFSIYKILNSSGIPISLAELSTATRTNKNHISKSQKINDTIFIKYDQLAEKYCTLLNLDFKTVAVIKEKIRNSPVTGHTPITIVAATIYQFCKRKNKNISMKKISSLMNVSCISIQRYSKLTN